MSYHGYHGLTLEERQTIPVIRKLLKRRPELAELLLKDMTREGATAILLRGQKELEDLLAFNRALSAAAGAIATHFKEEPTC